MWCCESVEPGIIVVTTRCVRTVLYCAVPYCNVLLSGLHGREEEVPAGGGQWQGQHLLGAGAARRGLQPRRGQLGRLQGAGVRWQPGGHPRQLHVRWETVNTLSSLILPVLRTVGRIFCHFNSHSQCLYVWHIVLSLSIPLPSPTTLHFNLLSAKGEVVR